MAVVLASASIVKLRSVFGINTTLNSPSSLRFSFRTYYKAFPSNYKKPETGTTYAQI